MGKVYALLWVSCVLLTTGLPSLASGCGITAKVTMKDGKVRVAEELRTLALVGEEVAKVEIWCRNTPPPHNIFHDGKLELTTSSRFPRHEMMKFGVDEQGAYRCQCGSDRGNNSLHLLRKLFHCTGCDVWSGVERAAR